MMIPNNAKSSLHTIPTVKQEPKSASQTPSKAALKKAAAAAAAAASAAAAANAAAMAASESPSSSAATGLKPPGTTETDSSNVVVIDKQRLQELVTEIDPHEQLDEEVEDCLLQMTDDFIDKLVANACSMAKHRGSNALEVRDIQLILEKYYNISIPGFGQPLNVLNRLNRSANNNHNSTTEAHKQRLGLIKRTLKKF